MDDGSKKFSFIRMKFASRLLFKVNIFISRMPRTTLVWVYADLSMISLINRPTDPPKKLAKSRNLSWMLMMDRSKKVFNLTETSEADNSSKVVIFSISLRRLACQWADWSKGKLIHPGQLPFPSPWMMDGWLMDRRKKCLPFCWNYRHR